jgi:hypothetical protein
MGELSPLTLTTERGGATPAFSGQLVYLQFSRGSPTLQSSGCPVLFATCLFFFFSAACLLFSFFFLLFLGGGQSVQKTLMICPREYHMLLICSPGGLLSR